MPFTTEQFLDVFRQYNEAVWPAQWALLGLAAAIVAVAHTRSHGGQRFGAAALAALWIWCGLAYHAVFFRRINPAAPAFGALFVAQGALLLLGHRTIGETPRFAPEHRVREWIGGLLITFALFVYPAIGAISGHRYPTSPTFGLPCPLTLFTFGILLATRAPHRRALLVIPMLWSLVGTVAAIQLGMWEDLSLPAAALTVAVISARESRMVHARRQPVSRMPPVGR